MKSALPKIILSLSLLLSPFSSFGESYSSSRESGSSCDYPITIPLWSNGAPHDSGLTLSGEVEKDGFLSHSASAELYIYPAENPNGTAIIMCPGGGYYGLAMYHEGKNMAEWITDLGITYVVLKYRMPNGNSLIPMEDVEEAIRTIRKDSKKYGIDPNSIGIMGASAGGHLASTLATHYSSPETRPDFQILFYPVITMEKGITHQGSRNLLLGDDPSEKAVNEYSNELHITPQTPEAFIMLSSDDTVVPIENSIRYLQALERNKVPASVHIYPTGGHGWGFGDNFTYKQNWTSELEKWLKERIIHKSGK